MHCGRWIVAIWCLASTPVWAAESSATADPADHRAAVAPLAYQSAFAGYRRHTDADIATWKAVNDNVGRIGGWRVYLKEAQQPDPPAPVSVPQSRPTGRAEPPASRGQHVH